MRRDGFRTYAAEDLDFLLGIEVGQGSEKKCFLSKLDKRRCFKVSYKENSNQIRREIAYFNDLVNRNVWADFLPKYYGYFESAQYIGYEQECFLAKDKGGDFDEVCSLSDYIENPLTDEGVIIKELQILKEEMFRTGIICSDLHGGNVYRVKENFKSRLVVIDGFGAPELIPICKHISYFRNKKIARQWIKFEDRLNFCFLIRDALDLRSVFS